MFHDNIADRQYKSIAKPPPCVQSSPICPVLEHWTGELQSLMSDLPEPIVQPLLAYKKLASVWAPWVHAMDCEIAVSTGVEMQYRDHA
eukprot:2331605-Prorocentrum_lima.AAC.1